MGLISRVFGKHQSATEEVAPAPIACLHTAMTPRWDRAEDIGHEDLATGFRCESCAQMFSAEEARELRRSSAERLRDTLSVN